MKSNISIDKIGIATVHPDGISTFHAWSAVLTSAALMSQFGNLIPGDAITTPKPTIEVAVVKEKIVVKATQHSPRARGRSCGGAVDWRQYVPPGLVTV